MEPALGRRQYFTHAVATFTLPHSAAPCLRRAAELRRDRRPWRSVLALLLSHPLHRSLSHFREYFGIQRSRRAILGHRSDQLGFRAARF
jgi:hypothetical protein